MNYTKIVHQCLCCNCTFEEAPDPGGNVYCPDCGCFVRNIQITDSNNQHK